MRKQTIAITGANSGIGLAATRNLAAKGHQIIMICRNIPKAEAARDSILQENPSADLTIVPCDLSSLQDVRRAARQILTDFDAIHVLVNNAGVMLTERQESVDGHESTFATNHLGPMLLTQMLRDRLIASSPARIINLSSDLHWIGRIDLDDLHHKRHYGQFRVYAASKLMNILFTRELARQLKGTGVVVNAMHPGVVASQFGPQKGLLKHAYALARPFLLSPSKGADTLVWLAESEEAGKVTGEYFARRRLVPTSPASKDAQLAAKLWTTSQHLIGH